MKTFTCAVFLFLALFQADIAQAQSTDTEQLPRWTLSGGVGQNAFFLPYFNVQVAYRTPLLNERLAFFVDYTLLNSAMTTQTPLPQTVQLGGRYHVWLTDWYRIYAQASVGAFYQLPGTNILNREFVPGHFLSAVATAGIGADLKITGPLWVGLRLGASYPYISRGEAQLMLSF